jgi:DNA invertase Pin-like site-specific DNA recombinase
MDFGYARASTGPQDLVRQLDALAKAGVPADRVYADEAGSATGSRPGLDAVLSRLRESDVLVVCTLDRLGRNLRDTLDQIHSLQERRIGLRTLAYDTPVDTTAEGVDGARGKLAIALLALFLPDGSRR